VLDLGRRLPVTAVIAGPVPHAVDLLGVLAELDDVTAGVVRLDLGFGDEHGSPFGVDRCAGATQ
jgi:hypothetical protein